MNGCREAQCPSRADLERLAYAASHDLRAPLHGIANVADWVEDDLGPALTPEVKAHLDVLRVRVRRLEALISGMATYCRAGEGAPPAERVDSGVLVAEVVEALALPEHTRVITQGPMPVLETPRAPLQQVFSSLLSNAAKHGSPKGGEIVVSAEDEGTFYRFSVKDGGPGIAPRHHDRIFTLFQTLAPRDREDGAGIGLAVVKKLVEGRGGTVGVDSAPGKGAVFVFTWPKSARG